MDDEAEDQKIGLGHCPAEHFLKFMAQEWMGHIMAALARNGTLRFGQLRRALPGAISARVLSARLKELEAAGYVTRREIEGRVRHVEYALTARGEAVDAALTRNEAFGVPVVRA
ncbi:helix-turn-helix transcriptional regulator [Xanthobacter autotrophicus]|uniref:winged helix-turn-helix transcriptional regulator n=1 Tax=Xanthobacter TaxID=279 RepID=UPI0024ABFD54|nr:helix-turn-helix domain-containing protein [Xanthobacter autotrophicus]MDI4664103.1 helix-turn-helix transcriptional regulator [Xanthobacter autotrophicus]